jgi:hypothetical protein
MTHFDLIERANKLYMPFIEDVNFDISKYPWENPWTYVDEKVPFDRYLFDIFVSFEHHKNEYEPDYWGSLNVQCSINRSNSDYQRLMNGGPSRREMYQILKADTLFLNRSWFLENGHASVLWGDWHAVIDGVVTSFDELAL